MPSVLKKISLLEFKGSSGR